MDGYVSVMIGGCGMNQQEITIDFCYSFAARFDIEAQRKTLFEW